MFGTSGGGDNASSMTQVPISFLVAEEARYPGIHAFLSSFIKGVSNSGDQKSDSFKNEQDIIDYDLKWAFSVVQGLSDQIMNWTES